MEYTFKTKQMEKVAEQVGRMYDIEMACYESNISVLVKLITIFGNVSEEEAYNYIDEQIEGKKKISDIYKEIIEGINKRGFFNQKIQISLETPPIDMEKMIKEMYTAKIQMEKDNMMTSNNM